MFKYFKEFAMRGNVVDMAIGIVIGAAFGTIVKSFVDDVPLLLHRPPHPGSRCPNCTSQLSAA